MHFLLRLKQRSPRSRGLHLQRDTRARSASPAARGFLLPQLVTASRVGGHRWAEMIIDNSQIQCTLGVF